MRLLRRLLWTATILYGLALVALLVLLRTRGDRAPLATALTFGPRWVAALPLPPLLLLSLIVWRRRLIGFVLLLGLLVAGPICGVVVSWRGLVGGRRGEVRLLTHNLGEVAPGAPSLQRLITALEPDVVLLQECHPEGPLVVPGYHVHIHLTNCLLSRFPITVAVGRDSRDVWQRGGAGIMARYELAAPGGAIHVANLHLETIRDGLDALMKRDLPGMQKVIDERRWESELARDFLRGAGRPLLVAGDFNMPEDSAIYRDLWSDFGNAFAAAGLGPGVTKRTRRIGVRIDHVLFGDGWRCVGARVAAETGSDHRPVVADFDRRR